MVILQLIIHLTLIAHLHTSTLIHVRLGFPVEAILDEHAHPINIAFPMVPLGEITDITGLTLKFHGLHKVQIFLPNTEAVTWAIIPFPKILHQTTSRTTHPTLRIKPGRISMKIIKIVLKTNPITRFPETVTMSAAMIIVLKAKCQMVNIPKGIISQNMCANAHDNFCRWVQAVSNGTIRLPVMLTLEVLSDKDSPNQIEC